MSQILELMQINHVSDMLINAFLGYEENSREQAIRLAIATELAGNPSILFLDLPTKGLDSHNSGHIIECLKRIADTGRMVISTLQSPSIRQIAAFTRAQILKKGGETVYFGPVGTDGELIQVYISLSFSSICSSFLCKQATSVQPLLLLGQNHFVE
jgi:ABC-type multidrug transport system ATPase subunit